MKKLLWRASFVTASVVAVLSIGLLTSWALEEKCPISGKPVDGKSTLNVNGKKIGFCCDKCPTAYAKKYLVKEADKICPVSKKAAKETESLIHLEAKKVAFCCTNCPKGFAKEQGFEIKEKKDPGKCPVSGNAAKAEHKLVVNGDPVHFCCDKCPKSYLKELNLQESDTSKCPVSKKDAKPETEMIVVTGKKVFFCCDKCPEGYISKEIKKGADKDK